jgi:hypothetical protein
MFYEKLAEAKEEKKRGQRNRLEDIGFNVGAGVLAHQGLKRGLDASAFSRLNEQSRMGRNTAADMMRVGGESEKDIRKDLAKLNFDDLAGTSTHNPLTKVVDTLSGAEGLRDTYKKHKERAANLWDQYLDGNTSVPVHEAGKLEEAALHKLRGRRLLGRRVAHGVGFAGALAGANKLRNMYNARKQRED